MRSTIVFLAAGLVSACSSSSSATSASSTSGGGAGSGAGTSSGTTGGVPARFTVAFPTISLGSGDEVTQCVVLSVGNVGAVHLGEIHDVLSQGAYDFVVYRLSDSQSQTTPFDCTTFSKLGSVAADSALILSNKPDDDMVLPAGVGLTLQPNQLVRLELHAYNPGATSLPVSATATLTAMADSAFQSEAALFLMIDPDIDAPANSTADTQGYLTVPDRITGTGLTVSQIAGYTHELGMLVQVSSASQKAGPFTSIYDPSAWSWSDSPRVDDQPAAQLPGGGGFQLDCTYDNTTPSPVRFGTSFQDEACMFQAYVYPSSGAFVCLHTDQSGGVDECCPAADGGCTPFP